MVANLPDSISVGIINVSIASCKIELFDKDDYQEYISTITQEYLINIINEYNGNPYAYLVDIANLAQEDGIIKGILLHQGEANTGDSQWPFKVQGVYDSLIYDLNLNPDLVPLLAGEVVHADQGGICANMNSIIATLPEIISNSYVISSSNCSDQMDNLHFDAAGCRKLGRRYAVKMLSLLGYESIYLEPECGIVGESWKIWIDDDASNNGYVTVASGLESIGEVPTGDSSIIQLSFTAGVDTTYYMYGRFDCPTTTQDSYWIKIDEGEFVLYEGLSSSGWQWIELNSFELDTGDHTLTIAYRENGAKLDKLCFKNSHIIPKDMGEEAVDVCEPNYSPAGIYQLESKGYALGQNYPNPFNSATSISFTIPNESFVSLKVFDMLGREIAELGGKDFNAGGHTIEFNPGILSEGNYFYTIKTNKFCTTRKMIRLVK